MKIIDVIKKSRKIVDEDFSIRENRIKRFDLIKEVFPHKEELGLNNKDIGSLFGLSETTISGYKDFDSYDDYCNYQSKRIKESKSKKAEEEMEGDLEELFTETKTVEYVNDQLIEEILNEIKTTNYFLKEIRDLLRKRRIF